MHARGKLPGAGGGAQGRAQAHCAQATLALGQPRHVSAGRAVGRVLS